MKRLLMLFVASTFVVACSSDKEPAQAAVNGLEAAVDAAQPDIERFAADRMAAVNDSVKAAKAKLDDENYAGAIADVQGATKTLTDAAEVAASRKAQLSTEWATFAGMPAMIGQIKGKVTELDAMRRLPRGMTKATLDGAKSSMDAASELWDDASDAHDGDDLAVAVAKAKEAKPMVESLMTTLGLSSAGM